MCSKDIHRGRISDSTSCSVQPKPACAAWTGSLVLYNVCVIQNQGRCTTLAHLTCTLEYLNDNKVFHAKILSQNVLKRQILIAAISKPHVGARRFDKVLNCGIDLSLMFPVCFHQRSSHVHLVPHYYHIYTRKNAQVATSLQTSCYKSANKL